MRAKCAGRAEPAHGRGSRGFGRGACRGVFGGFAPLPPGAACPADSPHYTWGRMTCGCFFPLETYRPALRAGVGEFGGRGSAAFGATADSGAYCKLSGESEAFRLRHAKTRKRQFQPTTRTKSVFLWGATPVSLGKTKEMGWQKVLQGPALVPPRGALRRAMTPHAVWPSPRLCAATAQRIRVNRSQAAPRRRG